MFARCTCDKELASICVFPIVCHTQEATLLMRVLEAFVFEVGAAVDRQTSCTIAADEVSTLDHEVLDDSMEPRPLVSLRVAAKPVLSRAELSEVLCSLWQLMRK